SSGLWSNVSTWLGAPFIIRKMTLFARPNECDGLEVSGLVEADDSAPYPIRSKNPSRDKSPVSARPAKPAPISQTNSRRLCRQGNSDLIFQSRLSDLREICGQI